MNETMTALDAQADRYSRDSLVSELLNYCSHLERRASTAQAQVDRLATIVTEHRWAQQGNRLPEGEERLCRLLQARIDEVVPPVPAPAPSDAASIDAYYKRQAESEKVQTT